MIKSIQITQHKTQPGRLKYHDLYKRNKYHHNFNSDRSIGKPIYEWIINVSDVNSDEKRNHISDNSWFVDSEFLADVIKLSLPAVLLYGFGSPNAKNGWDMTYCTILSFLPFWKGNKGNK